MVLSQNPCGGCIETASREIAHMGLSRKVFVYYDRQIGGKDELTMAILYIKMDVIRMPIGCLMLLFRRRMRQYKARVVHPARTMKPEQINQVVKRLMQKSSRTSRSRCLDVYFEANGEH